MFNPVDILFLWGEMEEVEYKSVCSYILLLETSNLLSPLSTPGEKYFPKLFFWGGGVGC